MKRKHKKYEEEWQIERQSLVAKLHAGHVAMAKRCSAVAAKYIPPGVTPVYRKSLSGRADFAKRQLHAPRPKTRKSLYIFLHECAHFHLHSNGHKPAHVREYEAELWAHQVMRNAGIAVPRSMTRRAKAYVAYKIRQAVARGAKQIDRKALAYAGLKIGISNSGTVEVVALTEKRHA